ncbi:MAG: hypothetical protein P9L94_18760 [Candidatus Hinthialibacter antarcticus]|nr:hypothetical protein [Candidatus Hinthialibacter antarcticus]
MNGPSLSTQCRQALLESLQSKFGRVSELRNQIHAKNSQTLHQISEWLDQEAGALLRPILRDQEVDGQFFERIKQTVIEELYSERLHPTLRISHIPIAPPVCDTVHCLLFEQLPNAYNELFPLMLDSYISDLERYGEARRLVIAAHVDWLDGDNCIARGAFYSIEQDELIEAPLECVLRFDSVHYLCISPKGHEAASRRLRTLNLKEVNPFPVSSIMDDKYECCLKWLGRGVLTPRAALIKRGQHSSDDIQQALRYLWDGLPPENALLVAQPNRGTEGRGVKAFRLPDNQGELFEHVQLIIKKDDVLLRCGIEGAYLVHKETYEKALFDIRVNVIYGVAESGYIQVAEKNAVIASPTQGGHIVEWKSLGQYFVEGVGGNAAIGSDLLKNIQFAAVQAARAFGDQITAGVDLRLSLAEDQIFEAWVLDVNPRPAGLGRSCFWNSEPGVTNQLWFQLPSIE